MRRPGEFDDDQKQNSTNELIVKCSKDIQNSVTNYTRSAPYPDLPSFGRYSQNQLFCSNRSIQLRIKPLDSKKQPFKSDHRTIQRKSNDYTSTNFKPPKITSLHFADQRFSPNKVPVHQHYSNFADHHNKYKVNLPNRYIKKIAEQGIPFEQLNHLILTRFPECFSILSKKLFDFQSPPNLLGLIDYLEHADFISTDHLEYFGLFKGRNKLFHYQEDSPSSSSSVNSIHHY
jgi:hypothetical protein